MSKAQVIDEHAVIHSTFTIEKTYPHPPARVFFGLTDKEMKRRWLIEGEGFEIYEMNPIFAWADQTPPASAFVAALN